MYVWFLIVRQPAHRGLIMCDIGSSRYLHSQNMYVCDDHLECWVTAAGIICTNTRQLGLMSWICPTCQVLPIMVVMVWHATVISYIPNTSNMFQHDIHTSSYVQQALLCPWLSTMGSSYVSLHPTYVSICSESSITLSASSTNIYVQQYIIYKNQVNTFTIKSIGDRSCQEIIYYKHLALVDTGIPWWQLTSVNTGIPLTSNGHS